MFEESARGSVLTEDHKGHIILLVAYDATFGEALLRLLKAEGYRCHFVRNEKQCLDVMREIKPELIILDLAYPDVDGYQILETKKNDSALAAIPVITISDKPKDFDSRRAVALGVARENQIVSAAIDPQEVMEKVTACFSEDADSSDTVPDTFHATGISADGLDNSAVKKKDNSVLKGKKILWVEDDKFFSNIFEKRLGGYGCSVAMTKNSDEAFAYLAKEKPDIIVLDLVLPGMSGFDILKKIRDDDTFAKVPILILSNLNQATDVERVKILGAQKYLVKAAVSLSEIVDEIEMLANQSAK